MIKCRYGIPGHEREWVIIIDGFNLENYIPHSISNDLQTNIPESAVLNRGSRVEIITNDDSEDMKRRILNTIENTFLEKPWVEEMRQ